ncbi:hypothetical protein [Mesorhizobium sp. SP-1A]|uniref:hypothetical protein n=1 Tax=Mesorhizobium sp. SP-1A TaxID=3077840 RepID=UPI0028F70FF0|nr:hypothetical protein [Mesorhizobium sp. SP-1A]
MEIKKDEVYRMHEDKVSASFVRVDAVGEDTIVCFPLSGGFQLNIPVSDFNEKFVHVSKAELERLRKTYEQKHFDFDDWSETLPAWTNGDRWNGWGCPHFERETLQNALDEGLLGNDISSKVIMLEDGVITIMALGGDLPKDYDWSVIEAKLRAGEEVYDFEIAPGVSIESDFFPKTVITTADGREIETFAVGAYAWCWNQYDEPQVHNLPTP